MSNLWMAAKAGEAARVGSFAIARPATVFRPWDGGGTPTPGNDSGAPDARPADLEAVRAEAYAAGRAEGMRIAEEAFAEDRADLERLAAALKALRPEPTNALALLLAETVDRLVRQVVGEVEIDAMRLLERARAAAALIGEATAPARLRVHPDDAVLLAGAELAVALHADPALCRGDIVLETGAGWIEDGPGIRLERLRADLDRIAGIA